MSRERLKGAFAGCSWCDGNGCICCDDERDKATKKSAWQSKYRPMFTADLNDPEDVKLLKETFGAEAVLATFDFDGGGMDALRSNAAMASLSQRIRKDSAARDHTDKPAS